MFLYFIFILSELWKHIAICFHRFLLKYLLGICLCHTVLSVTVTKCLPILKFIFWEEICPTSEKQTCNGAYGLSASRKENQGKEIEWWFEEGVVFFRAGLSQWGDIWAEREMRCRGQSLCHLKKKHKKQRAQQMQSLNWEHSFWVKNLEGGHCDRSRMDKLRVGDDEARGKKTFMPLGGFYSVIGSHWKNQSIQMTWVESFEKIILTTV